MPTGNSPRRKPRPQPSLISPPAANPATVINLAAAIISPAGEPDDSRFCYLFFDRAVDHFDAVAANYVIKDDDGVELATLSVTPVGNTMTCLRVAYTGLGIIARSFTYDPAGESGITAGGAVFVPGITHLLDVTFD